MFNTGVRYTRCRRENPKKTMLNHQVLTHTKALNKCTGTLFMYVLLIAFNETSLYLWYQWIFFYFFFAHMNCNKSFDFNREHHVFDLWCIMVGCWLRIKLLTCGIYHQCVFSTYDPKGSRLRQEWKEGSQNTLWEMHATMHNVIYSSILSIKRIFTCDMYIPLPWMYGCTLVPT